MKKISVVFLSVFFIIIFLSLAQSGQAMERMTTNFTFEVSADMDGDIIISFTPETKGKEGDGYVFLSYYGGFFLPEGDSLTLPSNENNPVNIARAYRTEKGIVIGEGKGIRVNPNLKEIPHDPAGLEKINNILYSGIRDNVNMIVDYGKKNLYINGTDGSWPVMKYDWVEVEFTDDSNKEIEPIYRKVYGVGHVKLPQDKLHRYKNFWVRAVIEDAANQRIIVSNGTRFEYRK